MSEQNEIAGYVRKVTYNGEEYDLRDEVSREKADAVEELRDEALEMIGDAVEDAGEAMEQKAVETIASIPDDYSTLSGNVSDLKSDVYTETPETIVYETPGDSADWPYYPINIGALTVGDTIPDLPDWVKDSDHFGSSTNVDHIAVQLFKGDDVTLAVYTPSSATEFTYLLTDAAYKILSIEPKGQSRVSDPYHFTVSADGWLIANGRRQNTHVLTIRRTKISENYLHTNQGAENNGKFMRVNAAGSIEPVNLDNPKVSAYAARKDLPNYYFTLPTESLSSYDSNEYLVRKINDIPDGKHFVFITDTHAKTSGDTNAMQSLPMMAYIHTALGINRAIHCGDVFDLESTNYVAVQMLRAYLNPMRDIFGGNLLVNCGNHDANTARASTYTNEQKQAHMIPYARMYREMCFGVLDAVHYQPETELANYISDSDDMSEMLAALGMFYYVDDWEAQTRYIVLNTGVPGVSILEEVEEGGETVTVETDNLNVVRKYFANSSPLQMCIPWVKEVLMSTPAGFNIVVSGHAIVSQKKPVALDHLPDNSNVLLQLLSAFAQGLSSATINFKYTYTEGASATAITNLGNWISGTAVTGGCTLTYDFSARPEFSKLFVLAGDCHRDTVHTYVRDFTNSSDTFNVYTDDDAIPAVANHSGVIPIITAQCDGYGVTAPTVIDGTVHTMTPGTVTEQCFDVVTVGENTVTFTRIGAGNDRLISFA